MNDEEANSHIHLVARSAALACACLAIVGCSAPRQPYHSCAASSQRLIEIAWRDQRAGCPSLSDCEFHVDEDRKGRCSVQVIFPGELTGNFVTLVLSEDGHIVERVPGV